MVETLLDCTAKTKPMQIFRTNAVQGFHLRPATVADDPQLVNLIAESMPANGVLLSFERCPSYLTAAYTQFERPCVMVAAADDQPEKILAMYNLGVRNCFINGVVKPLRYVGDLRINKTARGTGLISLLMSHLKECYSQDELYQTVILNDNMVARRVLHESRPEVPPHYMADQVETYTLTSFKTKKDINPNLRVSPMTLGDISAVNRFVRHMADYYNFLPAYNFRGLAAHEPYWNGLRVDDFFVIRRAGQIVGLFGLWNQKTFKQTRIADYSKLTGLMRPAYNYWAKLRGQLSLPQKGSALNYLMLHSVLCNPYNTSLFEDILRVAHQKACKRGTEAICFTLAENDPRRDCKQLFIAQKVQAMHVFHCFKDNPLKHFDARRISYLECGRI
ncbi:GNAT family N-acetyltransferase [Alkanindiges sp. WGS2144]|uniref:GNAT family N-acetyltransferase n=1 Tax=Alkanindiges sp. WGS2144 TaxID=3366808 RepID=UPI0037531083